MTSAESRGLDPKVQAKLLDSGWHMREVRHGNYTQFVLQPMRETDLAVWTKLRNDPNLTLDSAVRQYYNIK